MQPDGFDLLYEQGPCLIVSKPGGLLTQAPPGIDSLEARIRQFLKTRDQKSGRVYLGVPHRLDRPVSGGMVFCKHVRATRRIAEQFASRTIQKRYWALVQGRVVPAHASWTDHMRKIPDLAQAEIVASDHPDARVAVLHYRVVAPLGNATLVEIELETGRMHQIRLQAAVHGHPIWGDDLYGAREPFGPSVDDPRNRWIGLHAVSLRFRHPMTRENVAQQIPLPPPWHDVGLPASLLESLPESRQGEDG